MHENSATVLLWIQDGFVHYIYSSKSTIKITIITLVHLKHGAIAIAVHIIIVIVTSFKLHIVVVILVLVVHFVLCRKDR